LFLIGVSAISIVSGSVVFEGVVGVGDKVDVGKLSIVLPVVRPGPVGVEGVGPRPEVPCVDTSLFPEA
jgi:hypothetical protein